MRRYFKLLVLLLSASLAYAQSKPVLLAIRWPAGAEGIKVSKQIPYNSFLSDSMALAVELNKVLLACSKLSYLQASYASVNTQGDSVIAEVILGNSYKWIELRTGNVGQDILESAGFRENQFVGKTLVPEVFARRAERMLTYLENNGYPFATIKLDSIEADSAGVKAAINLKTNTYIVFDTADVQGGANVKKWYLYKYLGLTPGNAYNEEAIRLATSRISQLPFLSVSRQTSVYFYGNKAMPVLSLTDRKASSVDGIVGFAPNTNAGASAGDKMLITGEANLKLQNLFGTGKSFDLNYRSFLGNSQDLKIKFVYPYIFRTNLALDYELSLLKQDTTFLDVRNNFGLQYRFLGTDYVRVFYEVQSTSLITVDTNAIKASKALPASSDITNNTSGIGIKVSRFDYYLNPRKGYGIDFTGGVGVKVINRNPTIDGLKFYNEKGEPYSLYDTIPLEYVQYKLQGMAECYIPFFTRATMRLQANGGHLVSQNLFVNELFRIGGIRSLKGFDEQAIFASSYLIGNIELRYLIQQNSNILLFWNGAYYRNVVKSPQVSDRPFGFGAGMNFETGSGVFSIFYAVGKEMNNPINFNRAKVHFGFVNYF